MTKRMQVDGDKKAEIEDNVLWESEQYITFGGEPKIDFDIIGEGDGGVNDVIMCAVREDILETFKTLIEEAGVKLKIIDMQVFALSNIFEFVYEKEISIYTEGTALFDFGAQTTRIVVYKKGTAYFTKELAIGGVLITEEIQRQMGVGYEEAEDLKVMGDDGKVPEEIVKIIESFLEQWYAEIKKTLNFYISATSQEKIKHCFITGGASLTPGLEAGLAGILGTEIRRLQPFDRIHYDSRKFKKEDLVKISASATTLMGLALRRGK